jgi:acyl-homoserine-lactone acylase
MLRMAFDTYVLPADTIVPLLAKAHDSRGQIEDPRVRHAFEELRSWNRRSSEDSSAFTYLVYWAKAYEQMCSRAALARFTSYHRNAVDLESVKEQNSAWQALERAVLTVQEKFGRQGVKWGEINGVVRGGRYPLGGTSVLDVLHPDAGTEGADGRIQCDDRWGHLMVVMEGEPKEVWSLLPYDESEDPKSPHHNDQAKLHSQERPKRFWFSADDIVQHTESTWGDRDRIGRDLHVRMSKAGPQGLDRQRASRNERAVKSLAVTLQARTGIAKQRSNVRKVVARDGIEPPTPAFSGLRSTD